MTPEAEAKALEAALGAWRQWETYAVAKIAMPPHVGVHTQVCTTWSSAITATAIRHRIRLLLLC